MRCEPYASLPKRFMQSLGLNGDSLMRLFKREDGSSSLVSTIFLIPLLLITLISIVDMGIFFNNRAQIQNVARDAARTVAIYGGNGSATQATPIEETYGITRAATCNNSDLNGVEGFQASKYSNTECAMMLATIRTSGLVNTTLAPSSKIGNKIAQCNPAAATAGIGQEVTCRISWHYSPLPLSVMNFLMTDDNASRRDAAGLEGAALSNNLSSGKSVTETWLRNVGDHQALVTRSRTA